MALEGMIQIIDGTDLHCAALFKELNDVTDGLPERAVPRVAGRLASVPAVLCNVTQSLYREQRLYAKLS